MTEVKASRLYPLRDYHPWKDTHPREVKAYRSGEFRNPKKGEWYISGAIPEAYQAKNDLSVPYLIARIVIVKEVTTYILERIE